MKSEGSIVEPYTCLASVYDEVMVHVDYWAWSIYIADLICEFAPEATSLLELGCGTGSLAVSLSELIDISYSGFDRSAEMVKEAKKKIGPEDDDAFYVDDFMTFNTDKSFDVLLLLYDGLNYLITKDDVAVLLQNARNSMDSNSIFIFDVSTPTNSIKNAAFFEDSGKGDDFSYYRTSEYDPELKLHRTVFELNFETEQYKEEHVQRAYAIDDIYELIEQADLELVASLDDFTFEEADQESERVHFVVRRQVESSVAA